MTVLSDYSLIEYGLYRKMIVPFDEKLVNPTSYDVCWDGFADVYSRKHRKWSGKRYFGSIVLVPDFYYLLCTKEFFDIPNCIQGMVSLKSSSARRGVDHSFSGLVDAGFKGQLTLEMYTMAEDIIIREGNRVAQVTFSFTDRPVKSTYDKVSGHYQGQVGPTRAWTDDELTVDVYQ